MCKKQNIFYYFIAFGILFCASSASLSKNVPSYSMSFVDPRHTIYEKNLLMGTIQYPHEVERVPMVRIYCGGNKIKCEANDENKKLTFSVPSTRYQVILYLLITEAIEFETENNVVLCLKVPATVPYKLYVLERRKTALQANDEDICSCKMEQKSVYRWVVTEAPLEDGGKIPDNALIICANPDHIGCLEGEIAGADGSSAYELPKIVMRTDLLSFIGSEDKLHELSDKLLLSSLNWDTIHASVQPEINLPKKTATTIVALTT